jgi:hypothetical protein
MIWRKVATTYMKVLYRQPPRKPDKKHVTFDDVVLGFGTMKPLIHNVRDRKQALTKNMTPSGGLSKRPVLLFLPSLLPTQSSSP